MKILSMTRPFPSIRNTQPLSGVNRLYPQRPHQLPYPEPSSSISTSSQLTTHPPVAASKLRPPRSIKAAYPTSLSGWDVPQTKLLLRNGLPSCDFLQRHPGFELVIISLPLFQLCFLRYYSRGLTLFCDHFWSENPRPL